MFWVLVHAIEFIVWDVSTLLIDKQILIVAWFVHVLTQNVKVQIFGNTVWVNIEFVWLKQHHFSHQFANILIFGALEGILNIEALAKYPFLLSYLTIYNWFV